MEDGGTEAVRICSSSSPRHFRASVARWKSSQLSSMVRSSAWGGGTGRPSGIVFMDLTVARGSDNAPGARARHGPPRSAGSAEAARTRGAPVP
ncbi:hypothetical protein GCM10018987_57760 [Streptomyces cremeus]